MKIEQIAPDKVKVTLSDADLVDMEIDPTCFLSDTNALNGFIVELMHEIYEKTDFNPYHGNIKMEAQSETGGMTILLSKTNSAFPMPDKGKPGIKGIMAVSEVRTRRLRKAPEKKKIKNIRVIKPGSTPKSMQTFIFSDFENVCAALMRMSPSVTEISEFYRMDEVYALLIPTNAGCLDDIAMVMEFADGVRRAIVFEHIREHGELIAKGTKLSSMAEGIKKLEGN